MATKKTTGGQQAIYDMVTDRIIALLEQGVVPWRKTWAGGDAGGLPVNLVSRKPYRGVNVFLLACAAYGSPYWLTFNQAKARGGCVRKGEKGMPVIFWKWLEGKEDPETGKKGRIPLLRYYTVFNAEQCDGLKLPEPAEQPEERQHTPLEAAEAIMAGMPNAPEIRFGASQPAYSPLLDQILMPEASRFESGEEYYSTLFHEGVHATGHESRLGRFAGREALAGYGSDPYAREELVAEMGAAYLCATAGISAPVEENQAAYLQGWLKRLRGDSKLVVVSAAQAQKAADYILARPAEASQDED